MSFVKPTMPNSLSLRILLAYVFGVTLSILLMVLVALALTTFRGDLLLKADLSEYTRDLVEAVRFDGRGVPIGFAASEDDDRWIYESLKQETAYRVLDDAGRTMLVSAAGEGFWSPVESRRLVPGSLDFERNGVRMDSVIESFEHGGQDRPVVTAVGAWPLLVPGDALRMVHLGAMDGIVRHVAEERPVFVLFHKRDSTIGDASDIVGIILWVGILIRLLIRLVRRQHVVKTLRSRIARAIQATVRKR